MIKIYTYQKCNTCRKAIQWLKSKDLDFDEKAIRETPPTKKELQAMLKVYDGEIRRLFNTSGMDYRSLGLKDKLPHMSSKEAIQLLTENGNLVKRPFLLAGEFKAVGFKDSDWAEALV